jgi:hypothetical protein
VARAWEAACAHGCWCAWWLPAPSEHIQHPSTTTCLSIASCLASLKCTHHVAALPLLACLRLQGYSVADFLGAIQDLVDREQQQSQPQH